MADRRPLTVQFDTKGPYHVIRILDDDPGSRGDLSELIELVQQSVQGGKRRIAVVFAKSALLFTRSISALVKCYAILDDVQGTLSIVAPNPHLLNSIRVAGIDSIIKSYAAEEELPTA